MADLENQKIRLDLLPTEILRMVLNFLLPSDAKEFSHTSKRFREISLPFIFRKLEIEFSKEAFKKLKRLSTSDIWQHLVSLTYVVTDLLDPDIMKFNRFKSDFLTPERYVTRSKENHDSVYPNCPPYIVIYETLRHICKKQRYIIENGLDLQVLLSILGKASKLAQLHVHFSDAVEQKCLEWGLGDSGILRREMAFQQHLSVISRAFQKKDKRPRSIHLSRFSLPFYYEWENLSPMDLSGVLQELLNGVETLHLEGSGLPLEVLSDSVLNIRQLNMCWLRVGLNFLEAFLGRNAASICAVGCHNVRLKGINRWKYGSVDLSPHHISSMLKARHFKLQAPACCGALSSTERAWRLLVKCQDQQQLE
ncbi:hypothetical protein BBP40_007915 [Aspergillus hancockii]|nr:hypothetical protein BBP40_007915 [Aspergillus hancockii]